MTPLSAFTLTVLAIVIVLDVFKTKSRLESKVNDTEFWEQQDKLKRKY